MMTSVCVVNVFWVMLNVFCALDLRRAALSRIHGVD